MFLIYFYYLISTTLVNLPVFYGVNCSWTYQFIVPVGFAKRD